MNTLTIIYCAACLGLGFFAGMVLELAIDNNYLKKLEKENNKLQLEIEELTISRDYQLEIADGEEDYFKPF